jgi:hypothetical protein
VLLAAGLSIGAGTLGASLARDDFTWLIDARDVSAWHAFVIRARGTSIGRSSRRTADSLAETLKGLHAKVLWIPVRENMHTAIAVGNSLRVERLVNAMPDLPLSCHLAARPPLF